MMSTARIATSFVTCAAPSPMLASSAAGTSVSAARGRTAARSRAKHASTMSAASFSRLFAWICAFSVFNVAIACAAGIDVSEPRW